MHTLGGHLLMNHFKDVKKQLNSQDK